MKIALLTPYTGGNLGDAAIQEAVIRNVRNRHANAEIVLITLCPEVTSKLHGVDGFPIGVTIIGPGFELYSDEPSISSVKVENTISRIKAAAKKIELLRVLWPAMYRTYHWITRTFGLQEMVHILRATRLMRKVHILTVSGGGQLDDYWGGAFRHPYALLKWGLIARAVGARFIFLSVGTSSLSPLSKLFIHWALKLADYRSYRDEVSKAMLANMPCTWNDMVYPDLAFSYTKNVAQTNRQQIKSRPLVGVSPIAYLSRYGWPERNGPAYESYVASLGEFIIELISRGYEILFFSTDPVDLKVIDELVNFISTHTTPDLAAHIAQPNTLFLEDLMDQLDEVDIVVASRLHGIVLSHLLAKPVLAISYDRKVDTHMADMKMNDYCLNFCKIDTPSIIQKFEKLVSRAYIVSSQLKELVSARGLALQEQYDIVLNNAGDRFP